MLDALNLMDIRNLVKETEPQDFHFLFLEIEPFLTMDNEGGRRRLNSDIETGDKNYEAGDKLYCRERLKRKGNFIKPIDISIRALL